VHVPEGEDVKIVLSRKGFDSATGGFPSPIYPDGRMCYLPIPSLNDRIRYGALKWHGASYGPIVKSLTQGRLTGRDTVHLDPDIDEGTFCRKPGWRGIFGQAGPAAAHLDAEGVGRGDIFLYFGWYRQVDIIDGRPVYCAGAPDLHVIFGWLQVGSVRKVDQIVPDEIQWARYHPHLARKSEPTNTVYIARRKLSVSGLPNGKAGYGHLGRIRPNLILTAPDSSKRSLWRLPEWFHPAGRSSALTYHADSRRWRKGRNCVFLRSVGRGQEFVLDTEDYPEARAWVQDILK